MIDRSEATSNQVRTIAKLSMALGIKAPIEEKKMTFGEAGFLVRNLYAQLRAKNRSLKRRL